MTVILGIYLRCIFRVLRRKAKKRLGLESVDDAWPGAVTGIQRSSANLRLNAHFHCLVTDGVFVRQGEDGPVIFHELPPPTPAEVEKVAWETCRRVCRYLARQGAWRDLPDPQAGARTVYGFLSLGPESAHREVRFTASASRHEVDAAAERPGGYPFDIWARQRVRRGDRKKRDKLVRYILSPPFVDEQITLREDGDIDFELKRPRRDGTRSRRLTPHEWMDALATLTPRPRVNLIRFHGLYAPNARLRREVVPQPRKVEVPPPANADEQEDRLAWSHLSTRAYTVDFRRCPRCTGGLLLTALRSDRVDYDRLRRRGVPPDIPFAANSENTRKRPA